MSHDAARDKTQPKQVVVETPRPDDPEPEAFEGSLDVFFVVLSPADVRPLTFASPEPLFVGHSGETQLNLSVKDKNVIVVRPAHGPGRQEALDVRDRLLRHAARVGLWTIPELGRESVPDLKTFDETWGVNGKDGLAILLKNERPWDNAATWANPVIQTNGKPRFTSAGVDEDDGQVVGDVVGDVDRIAYHGVMGRLALSTQPETEANPLFVLCTLLVFFGIAVGRTAYFIRSARRHYMNLFVAVIGESGISRKGTSADVATAIFRRVDQSFTDESIRGGLNSGPGLLHNLRDPSKKRIKKKGGKTAEIEDEGVENKLRVCMETEFGSVLKQGRRENDPLFETMRKFFDGDECIRSDTKGDPLKVTGGHVGVVAHGTPSDMDIHVPDALKDDGTLNRYLVIYGTRSKVLPRGGDVFFLLDQVLGDDVRVLRDSLVYARGVGRIHFSGSVEKRWDQIYREFSSLPPGRIGNLFVRAPIIILRLASIFALADLTAPARSIEVQECHLDASLAIWKQSERSLRWLFPDDIDADAEKLLAALKACPEPLTRSQIRSDVFKGHMGAKELNTLLSRLCVSRRVEELKPAPTGGRPASRYRLKDWS
jgi:uncharacterized protein DUF3987